MAVLTERSTGTTAKFFTPVSNTTKTVTVDGVVATIASQDATSVTLAAIPVVGSTVAITYFQTVALGSFRVLGQSAVAAAHTGTIVDATLRSFTIPGNTLGPNGALRITSLWSMTNSVNSKSAKISIGATDFAAVPVVSGGSLQLETIIRNRGATNSQVAFNPTGAASSGSAAAAPLVAAIDTTVDQVLMFKGILAVGTETITLEGFIVEILPG